MLKWIKLIETDPEIDKQVNGNNRNGAKYVYLNLIYDKKY